MAAESSAATRHRFGINPRAAFWTAVIAAEAALAVWGPSAFLRWIGLVGFAWALISAIKGAK